MVIVVRGTVCAAQLALHQTLELLPGVEIECEQIVLSGEQRAMPLLWVRYADREAIDAAFEADPSVEAATCLSAFDEEYLYEVIWTGDVRLQLLLQMLTNGKATIMAAYGGNGAWQFRLLYPDREHFSRAKAFADAHGLPFEMASIREVKANPSSLFGLTEPQYEALVLATHRGFFDIPKGTSLQELSHELGISHQALSERIRRATGTLVRDTLVVGSIPEEAPVQ